jgi:hypothetical protein
MRWPFRRDRSPDPGPRLPHARPLATLDDGAIDDVGDLVLLGSLAFVCADCGRTDLAPAGDWDPPICEECDAAINFDTLTEELDEDG